MPTLTVWLAWDRDSPSQLRILTDTDKATGDVGTENDLLGLKVEARALALGTLSLGAALRGVKVGVGKEAYQSARINQASVTYPSTPKRARVPATAAETLRRSQGRLRFWYAQ